MTVGRDGIGMHVTQSNRALDAVWDAVEEAQSAGMTPQQFMREAQQAWEYYLREKTRVETEAFRKLVLAAARGEGA